MEPKTIDLCVVQLVKLVHSTRQDVLTVRIDPSGSSIDIDIPIEGDFEINWDEVRERISNEDYMNLSLVIYDG